MGQKRFSGASPDRAIETELEALLQRLYSFHSEKIDLKLDRTFRFLERLGNPHLRLPKVVHVAGTNGKGSTVATLRALLEASGHTVHCYTSPHLVHITERITLAGKPINSEALLHLLNECIEINQDEPITFFELFTCAAFLGFSRVPADFLLLETGMGGRLDTTNVIPDPVATIITTISYDHMAFLGNTLADIAKEKAGIMKPGVPCIIGHQTMRAMEEGVLEVLQNISQGLSPAAPLVRYGAEWSSAPESDQMLFRYGNDSILLPKPSLSGNHQIWNAGAALAAFKIIAPEHFNADILSTGLAKTCWPGRLQTLENHPYNEITPASWEIIIDGGHNDTGGEILADQMAMWAAQDDRPLHLVVAMVDRKDAGAFLKPLQPYADYITLTHIDHEEQFYAPETLTNIAKGIGFSNISTSKSPENALKEFANNIESPAGRVLITGSLYLMGNILALTRE